MWKPVLFIADKYKISPVLALGGGYKPKNDFLHVSVPNLVNIAQ